MKILVKDGKYQKVPNDWIAHDKVTKLGWAYSNKSEWKKNVRDTNKVIVTEIKEEKPKKVKKQKQK